MTFEQAKLLREDLIHMIGESYDSLTIKDVVITPLDEDSFNDWKRNYQYSKDVYASVLPYSKSNLIVEFIYLINGRGYDHTGIFLHGNVLTESKKFGLEIELKKYGLN